MFLFLFYYGIYFIEALVLCAIKQNATILPAVVGLLERALILFYCTLNHICNKIQQNVYFIAALIYCT